MSSFQLTRIDFLPYDSPFQASDALSQDQNQSRINHTILGSILNAGCSQLAPTSPINKQNWFWL